MNTIIDEVAQESMMFLLAKALQSRDAGVC